MIVDWKAPPSAAGLFIGICHLSLVRAAARLTALALAAVSAQSGVQLLFLLPPATVLSFRPFFEGRALGFDGAASWQLSDSDLSLAGPMRTPRRLACRLFAKGCDLPRCRGPRAQCPPCVSLFTSACNCSSVDAPLL